MRRAHQEQVKKLDDEIWAILSNFPAGSPPFPPSSSSERKVPSASFRAGSHTPLRPPSPPSSLSGISSLVRPTSPQTASPGHSPRQKTQQRGTKNIVGPPSAPSGPGPAGASSQVDMMTGWLTDGRTDRLTDWLAD
ncbi:proline-rich receptor-like protein kinase PERK1 [Oncorhynchus tshawytscha]|uniref:proline-rich receptor-like protein kinase PERK1 n=1 Tax=Oncorhynchus tshawytscha TaxID=74940 RepID=UPI000D0A1508|nr:proline-rich receptor-like protein kinase PERK1 [Oncorhynchus tshawytscha]